MTFHYTVGGLKVRSVVALPALPSGPGNPDLTISLSEEDAPTVPHIDRQGPNWQVGGGDWLVWGEGGGRAHLRQGHTLTLWGRTEAQRAEAWGFVRSAAFSAAFLFRGRLPLHASAVAFGGQAFLIYGASGAGKSTLSAAFTKAGATLVADDLCSPEFLAEVPMVRPVFLRGRLLPDAAAALGLTGEPCPDGKLELPTGNPGLTPLPIGAMLALGERTQGDGEVMRLTGVEAVGELLTQLHGLVVAPLLVGQANLLDELATLCRSVPVYRVHAPDRITALPAFAATLAERLAGAQP